MMKLITMWGIIVWFFVTTSRYWGVVVRGRTNWHGRVKGVGFVVGEVRYLLHEAIPCLLPLGILINTNRRRLITIDQCQSTDIAVALAPKKANHKEIMWGADWFLFFLADCILIFVINVLNKIFIHSRVETTFTEREFLNFVLDEEILQFELVTMIG